MKSCWALALAAGALSAQATVEWNGVVYPQTLEEAKQQEGFIYMTEGDPTSSRTWLKVVQKYEKDVFLKR